MAIYHFSIKVFSRGKGASVIEKAAYRSGEKLLSDYNGQLYDYTRKGGVVHAEILLPNHAPGELSNRSILWNSIENSERNGNAQLAREIEVSLPRELSIEQNINLAREFAQKVFVSAGMCADVCVHDKKDNNPHAHIMLTLRPIDPDGRWGAKSKKEYILDKNGERIRLESGEYKSRKIPAVDWSEQSKAEDWRAAWAEMANAALERKGFTERIDHRSYERQGIDKVPSIHLGPAASQMERKGIKTDRGDINRRIADINKELSQTKARLNKLKKWLAEESQTVVPTLYDVVSSINSRSMEKSRWKCIADVKTAARILVFLQNNGITELSQLKEKVAEIRGEFNSLRDNLKKADRRIGTLDKHIKQAGIYFEHKGKIRTESEEILFTAAKKYLEEHLNGRTDVPLKKWKSEYARLTSERSGFYQEYSRLKEKIRDVETIKRTAEKLMAPDKTQERIGQETISKGIGL